MPRIMVHICCAPCATHAIEELKSAGEVAGVFVNPNIQPEEEYQKRLLEARKVAERRDIPLFEEPYDPESWQKAVEGLEDEPEGGKRCEVCFKFRLERAARTAARHGFDYLTTTLTISPHKDAGLIHLIGKKIAADHGINFRTDNFKKKGGFRHSVRLSQEWGLYRQNYCGCPMSRRDD